MKVDVLVNCRRLSAIKDARRVDPTAEYFVTLTITLPYSKTDFGADKQQNYQDAIASAAKLQVHNAIAEDDNSGPGFNRVPSGITRISSVAASQLSSVEAASAVAQAVVAFKRVGSQASGTTQASVKRPHQVQLVSISEGRLRKGVIQIGTKIKAKHKIAADAIQTTLGKGTILADKINTALAEHTLENSLATTPPVIIDHIPPPKHESSVLLHGDYHFAPCVACISLWSGTMLSSPAFPTNPIRNEMGRPSEVATDEPDEVPRKMEVEDKYSTEGGLRMILGSKEGVCNLYESRTRDVLEGGKVAKHLVLRAHIHSHHGQVHCVRLYDDANSAISFGADSKIVIYDMPHRQVQHVIRTLHAGAILCGDVSPDYRLMLSGGFDGNLFLWDLKNCEKLCTMGTRPKDKTRKYLQTHERVLENATPWELGKSPWPGGKLHSNSVKCAAFVKETPARRLVSGGWDARLLVWDLETYASFHELEGHTARISGCATSYDVRYCCSVSEDKTVRVWDIDQLASVAVLQGHEGNIFWCDLSSWEIYEPLLLTCGADGEFRVWDLRRKEFRDVLPGHYDSCLACAITQDGRYGTSVSEDGTVRVWQVRRTMELNITFMVGEAGSGIYKEWQVLVDPRDDVLSAKEQVFVIKRCLEKFLRCTCNILTRMRSVVSDLVVNAAVV